MYEYDRWLWGKSAPFCSLSRHMLAVAACAREYLGAPSSRGLTGRLCDWMNMDEEQLMQTLAYVFALHDIGKAHPSFQPHPAQGEGYREAGYRHERYGARLLKEMWRRRGWDNRGAALLSAVVRLHHQGKVGNEVIERPSAEWAALHDSLENRMRTLFLPVQALPPFDNADALGVLLTAVLIICDWVASSSGFAAESLPDMDDGAMFDALRERAREVLAGYGLIGDTAVAYPRKGAFPEMFPQIAREAMRPLQRTCETVGDVPALLTIIEAPMGEGKTEAALFLAGKLCRAFDKRGVYMALPTAATSNQMVDRVRRMLDGHQSGTARLLHSMAWLVDERSAPASQFDTEDAESAADWLRPLRRGMLSENAVGTVDQAMAAALRIKYGFLRLAGLENKVLVIDEIHAYDVFMSTIIARLLEWCRAMGVPVILLSATMQNSQRQRYLRCFGAEDAALDGAYPLITQCLDDGRVVQTPVSGTHMRGETKFASHPCGGNLEQVVALVRERAAAGGCICVMMNTVRKAQAVYRALKSGGETRVMLFHARFTAKRRNEIERACVELFGKDSRRPDRMILVCTQVVEQSLDIDMDAMVTQLAPMDLLLQRAGRVHRHTRHARPKGLEEPVVDVIVPEKEAASDIEERYAPFGGIYSPIVMKNTERLLARGRRVRIPEDVRACVEAAYRDISDEALEAEIKRRTKDELSVNEAEGELLKRPRLDRFFAQVASGADSLCLADSDEDQFLRGARTREGDASQRFVFLPVDFPEQTDSRAWLRQAMAYSCSCPIKKDLTKQEGEDIIKRKNDNKRCIFLRPDEDGLYRWENHAFAVSEEYGIEEVRT